MNTTKKLAIIFAMAATSLIAGTCSNENLSATTSTTRTAPNASLTIGSGIWAMSGHRNFCGRIPAECGPNDKVQIVQMNDAMMRMLDRVNRQYNAAITFQYDRDQYGREEYWNYPDSGFGDCEDYALAKRRELIKRGWPPSSLLIAVLRTETDEAHAVLVARTTAGDFVLDNRHSDVKAWHELPYKWLQIQSPEHSGHWRSLRRGNNPAAPLTM